MSCCTLGPRVSCFDQPQEQLKPGENEGEQWRGNERSIGEKRRARKRAVAPEKVSPPPTLCMSEPVAHPHCKEEQPSVPFQDNEDFPLCEVSPFDRIAEDYEGDSAAESTSGGHFTGEKHLPNGDFYVGTWQGGLPDGAGKYLWSDGCMYEGEWGQGKKTGRGKISWPSGATYEGGFRDGYMHGVGTYTGIDGTTYKGEWSMNVKNGTGQKCYANGDLYDGNWKQGLQEGHGRYVWNNGNEYVGEWKGGSMCGHGVLSWASGDIYDGQWLDGLEHGRGVYTWADGGCYVGTWTKGLKDGKGVFYPVGRHRTETKTTEATKTSAPHFGHKDDQHLAGIDEHRSSVCRVSNASSSSELDQHISLRSSQKLDRNASGDAALNLSSVSGRRNVFLERRWSLEGALERVLGLDRGNSWTAGKLTSEGEETRGGSRLSLDGASSVPTVVPPIVVREYVQGVLMSEFVKESVSSTPSKHAKRRQKRKADIKRPGETIFKGHRSYDLMLNLQLGIRYTVGKVTLDQKREIRPSDFSSRSCLWMKFPKEGSQLTPPHQSVDFKWKDYCPMVFRDLRDMFKIDVGDYMMSLCGNDALRELSSPGKSGSVFYLSHDDRFIIKTMRKTEVKVLLRMLKTYHTHVHNHENTLITKFFGLHRVKPTGGRKVRFVVMGNMFCTELRIHRRFDLKGSSQGRSTEKAAIDETTTLKDLDLDFVFRLDPAWRDAFLRQVEYDCKFLESQGIMDYSLLLGLHFRAPQYPAITTGPPTPEQSLDNVVDDGSTEEDWNLSRGLVLVARGPGQEMGTPGGSHIRGSPLRAAARGEGEDGEVDLLVPGTARLRIQLGVNMPARADRIPGNPRTSFEGELFGEFYDVVLYFGIIDILQQYDITKKLEHAYKSFQFDSTSISAVDPSLYATRFQAFLRRVFPPIAPL